MTEERAVDKTEELRRLWMRSQPREIRRADIEVGPWVLVLDGDFGGPRWRRAVSVDGVEGCYGAGVMGRNPFGYDHRAVHWRVALRGRNVAHYALDVSGNLGRLGDVQAAKDAADAAFAAWVAEAETVTISGDPKAFDGFPVYRLGELFDEIDRLRGELEEARATLLNERGEQPPAPHWEWLGDICVWYHTEKSAEVSADAGGWDVFINDERIATVATAREGMRLVDAGGSK